jgi:hypothetical protein
VLKNLTVSWQKDCQKRSKKLINFPADNVQRRVLRSLVVIALVNVGGYLINSGLMFIGLQVLPYPWNWYQIDFNGVLLNLAAAMNAPILYWIRQLCLSDYSFKKWIQDSLISLLN